MDRNLDQAILEHIEALDRDRSKIFSNGKHQIKHLAAIGRQGTPAAVPFLLDWTLNRSRSTRQVAIESVRRLLGRLPVLATPWFDQFMRQWRGVGPLWRNLDVRDFEKNDAADRALLLRVASTHPSGFVRESAILAMDEDPTDGDIPFLAVRASDWVEPVRRLAHQGIRQRFQNADPGFVLQILPLFLELTVRRRFEASEFMPDFERILSSEDGFGHLLSTLGSTDLRVRRAAFDLGARLNPNERFLRTALDSPDQILRLYATRLILDSGQKSLFSEVLRALGADPYPPVRRLAIENCIHFDGDRGLERFKTGALDSSRSIRELCQQQLMFEFDHDVGALYGDVLERPQNEQRSKALSHALDGLREVGGAEDAQRAVDFLDHQAPKVRVAALRLLTRFDAPTHRAATLRALKDTSSSVCGAAIQIIERQRLPLQVDELWRIFGQAQSSNRPALLKLLRFQDFWTHLSALLKAVRDEDDQVGQIAQDLLWRLLLSGRFMPSLKPGQVEGLRRDIQASRDLLPRPITQQLDFIVSLEGKQ